MIRPHVPNDVTAPDAASDAEHAHARRQSHRFRRTHVLAVIGVVVIAGGAFVAYRWSQRGAAEVSTKDAIARYRQEEGTSSDSGSLRPANGVYTYQARGTERLSLLGTSQQWGPTMPVTVTHDTGKCWALRIDYNTNHSQTQQYCPSGTQLLDLGERIYQSFDFGVARVSDTNVITCKPPGQVIRVDAQPGDSWRQSCNGRGTGQGTKFRSAGTNTFVGIEKLRIDGKTVPALHYRQRRTLSGDQTGTEDTNSWFAIGDAMLLRSTHDTHVTSSSPIGNVTYTERGQFQLASRTPRR
jgi:hypothetical protein